MCAVQVLNLLTVSLFLLGTAESTVPGKLAILADRTARHYGLLLAR